MRARRVLASVAAGFVAASGLVMAGASPASADQVWQQSVGRASADAVCPTSDPADLATGWSEWAASWEEWANDGKGGYVCTRAITWAKDTPPPGQSVGPVNPSFYCVAYASGRFSVDFQGLWYFPVGTQTWGGGACGPTPSLPSSFNFVRVPAGYDALALCQAAWPASVSATYRTDPDFYICG